MKKSQRDGVLIIDKPEGPTSHDVVLRVRRILQAKVGHTGTLDPLATGVLPLVIGKATRLTQFLQGSDKEYSVGLKLGIATDTYDSQGKIMAQKPVPPVDSIQAQAILETLRGRIIQKIPAFSAVKVGGERLYHLARKEVPVDTPERRVSIHALELIAQEKDLWKLRVHCSAGTYIRSLVHEIGEMLGCGAHVVELRRIRSGSFSLRQATSLTCLSSQWAKKLIPLDDLLPSMPSYCLKAPEAARILQGNSIDVSLEETRRESSPWMRLIWNDTLLAIGKLDSDGLRPRIVLRSELLDRLEL